MHQMRAILVHLGYWADSRTLTKTSNYSMYHVKQEIGWILAWIVWCNLNLPPYCMTWLLVSWLLLCRILSDPECHLTAHISLSIWDGYPTSSTLPSFSHPNLNHPYKAGSNDFRPFLATQVLNELLLLRIFIVLVHPIWPSRTVYWNTWCLLVAAVWIWTGLCVQGLGL